MGRQGKPWQRSDRPGWFASIRGKQEFLGMEYPAALREYHRRKAASVPVDASRASVQLLVDRYLGWAKGRLSAASWKRYRSTLQAWVDEYGRTKASELRPYHVTRWLDGCKNWNESSRHTAGAIVRLWSAWCKGEGYVEVDHLRGLRLPSAIKRAPAADGDLEIFESAIESEPFQDFFLVLRDTGCRPGEIRSLRAANIDWSSSTAEVRGKRGKRVIGLTMRAMKILRRYQAMKIDGPLLRAPSGNAWSATTLKNYWDRTRRATGLMHIVPYHLRHNWWARAHASGVDSVLIAKQLGHVDLNMLASVYAHPTASQLAAAAESAASHGAKAARADRHPKPGKVRSRPKPRHA